jgi:hypothetical protein
MAMSFTSTAQSWQMMETQSDIPTAATRLTTTLTTELPLLQLLLALVHTFSVK